MIYTIETLPLLINKVYAFKSDKTLSFPKDEPIEGICFVMQSRETMSEAIYLHFKFIKRLGKSSECILDEEDVWYQKDKNRTVRNFKDHNLKFKEINWEEIV